jgi:hypothetical protein
MVIFLVEKFVYFQKIPTKGEGVVKMINKWGPTKGEGGVGWGGGLN